MKNLTRILMFFLFGSLFMLNACDDDDESFEPPVIQAVSSTLTEEAGNAVNATVAVFADAGIKTITYSVDGGTENDITGANADKTSAIVSHSFTIPATAADDDEFIITMTVTDMMDISESVDITVIVSPVEIVFLSESASGTGTATWTSNKVYVLEGKIFVNDGQTLTIEPGTVIKGQAGQAENASALIVARGGKIMAKGSATNPIIFTALADDTERTDDLPTNARGLWGGVIMLGNAYINHANGQTNIEGITANETEFRSLYGVGADTGTGGKTWARDDDHNGGELSYASIRHGGTNIGAGNEINGLTMGGVGRGTVIHHVEVYANDDDGFEWFGGTVNTSYLAALYNQDDSFDMDFGWRSENQFWVAVQEPGFSASNRGFESDGAHSGNLSADVFTQPQIYNATIIGAGSGTTDNNVLFMTEGFGGLIHNSIFMNFGQGINLTTVGATGKTSRDRLTNGELVFKNNIFFQVGDGSMGTLSDGLQALETHLTANSNEIANPGVAAPEASGFAVLPAAGSLALTKAKSPLPATNPVNGFTYEDVNFIGAFGTTNWLDGWTAADAYGLLK
jgi:hypothetical protein